MAEKVKKEKPLPKNKRVKTDKLTLTQRNKVFGWVFISPWLIGVTILFIIPLIQSAMFSFSDIQIENGFKLVPVGFQHYNDVFTTEAAFIQQMITSVLEMLYKVPIIVFLSLFVAMILKDKFRGRTLARALFFLPVIIASGVILGLLANVFRLDAGSGPDSVSGSSTISNLSAIQGILSGTGLSEGFITTIVNIVQNVFDLTWKSGVQILLLMAALHNIPASSYEVAAIEGATEWEKFWKVTFPLVSPTLLVSVIYTIIDSFTDYGNAVMVRISSLASNASYEKSTTLSLIYFAMIMVLIIVMYIAMSTFVFYEND